MTEQCDTPDAAPVSRQAGADASAEPPSRAAKTVTQFIRDWPISRAATYELIRAGKLRAVRCGRKSLILAADEARFAASLPEIQLHHRQPKGNA